MGMRVRPLFSLFWQEVLQVLGVTPSQLHPNGWGFMKAFELLIEAMDRLCSRQLFFTIFGVSRGGELGNNRNCRERLSFKVNRKYKIFNAFSDSLKRWKNNYFWVSPISENIVSMVAKMDAKGVVVGFNFPNGWSKSHYNRKPATYVWKEEQLDADDRETLRLLQNLVTYR